MKVGNLLSVSRPLSAYSSGKLFLVGSTAGTVVDSLHNQCLLTYQVAPISIPWPHALQAAFDTQGFLFCSSWAVPPLLGVAYVVLGAILPRLFQRALSKSVGGDQVEAPLQDPSESNLRRLALTAVCTTAAIIKLSDFLERHGDVTESLSWLSSNAAEQHEVVLAFAAFVQWIILDGSVASFAAASLTAIGGPLSELPFVANGIWTYLPEAADYYPLANIDAGSWPGALAASFLGEDYYQLGLASITGPCYFAVTLDAIALGRWFDSKSDDETTP